MAGKNKNPDFKHNSSNTSNVQDTALQHNNRLNSLRLVATNPKQPLRYVSKRELRQARARLYVRGLLTKAENERVAARIENFSEFSK